MMKDTPTILTRKPSGTVEAVVRYGLVTTDLIDAESQWSPYRLEAYRMAVKEGKPIPENNHWDWMRKANQVNRKVIALIGIQLVKDWEGLLAYKTRGSKQSRKKGDKLLYVDYLQTAPWNDIKYVMNPRHGGVGTRLLQAAIELAYQSETMNRVGLHSLPGSESFYRDRFEMTEFGPDPAYDNLSYFELSSSQVAKLVRQWRQG